MSKIVNSRFPRVLRLAAHITLDKDEMKIIREILRTILMLSGSIFFVAALIPVLNPEKFELATKNAPVPAELWIAVTLPVALVMLIAAWLLNPKKQMPRQSQKGVQQGGGEERR